MKRIMAGLFLVLCALWFGLVVEPVRRWVDRQQHSSRCVCRRCIEKHHEKLRRAANE